jgi:YbbR domain-containing protein
MPWSLWLKENVSYKTLAFFIAVVIWVTLLGRRDFVVEDEVQLQLLVSQQYMIKNRLPRYVLLKVTGSRGALKNFSKNLPLISIDLGHLRPGNHSVMIPTSNLELPVGVKVLSVVPEQIRVQIGLPSTAKGHF